MLQSSLFTVPGTLMHVHHGDGDHPVCSCASLVGCTPTNPNPLTGTPDLTDGCVRCMHTCADTPCLYALHRAYSLLLRNCRRLRSSSKAPLTFSTCPLISRTSATLGMPSSTCSRRGTSLRWWHASTASAGSASTARRFVQSATVASKAGRRSSATSRTAALCTRTSAAGRCCLSVMAPRLGSLRLSQLVLMRAHVQQAAAAAAAETPTAEVQEAAAVVVSAPRAAAAAGVASAGLVLRRSWQQQQLAEKHQPAAPECARQ